MTAIDYLIHTAKEYCNCLFVLLQEYTKKVRRHETRARGERESEYSQVTYLAIAMYCYMKGVPETKDGKCALMCKALLEPLNLSLLDRIKLFVAFI